MTGTRAATIARFSRPWDNYISDHISQIIAPTLVLSGKQDQIIPVETARAFAKAIKGAKLITYPATGHIPQKEVPDQSAADVGVFLTKGS
jgi:pimeloyl-ACP methyl ester carboxylesterase